jgi:uncharacterized protein (DUF169 family)
MMDKREYEILSRSLGEILGLQSEPLAISFLQEAPEGMDAFEEPMPEAAEDGRTGRVLAGCVFWIKGLERSFTTVAEDHANCSVGSVTHGFKTLEEVGDKSDVAILVQSGWVNEEVFPHIPYVEEKPNYVSYGPLAQTSIDPDVVFVRLNPKQAMVMSDAFPEMRFEGKPQCHILAIAKEQEQIAASVGCMLSRVRTGIPSTEMTCAIPGKRLAEVVQKLKTTCAIDDSVADYASKDAKRFGV